MKDYLKPIFWIRFSLKFPRLYIFIVFKIQTCNHNSTSFTFLSIKKKYSQSNYVRSELHNQRQYSKKEFGMNPGREKKL